MFDCIVSSVPIETDTVAAVVDFKRLYAACSVIGH
jgi:hypothetical protein